MSEIGEDREQLDLIVTGNLEHSGGDIKAQLGGVYYTCKEQGVIPIDLDLEVRDIAFMLV